MTHNKDMPYAVTEWEWFLLQLQCHLTKYKTELYYIATEQPGTLNDKPLRIQISDRATEQWIYQKISKKELHQRNMVYIYAVKEIIRRLLDHFPGLKNNFSLDKDVIFEIMCDTGKASHKIGEVIGTDVTWDEGWVKDLPD